MQDCDATIATKGPEESDWDAATERMSDEDRRAWYERALERRSSVVVAAGEPS